MLGNNKLLDVLSADRERIMSAIRGQVNTEMQNFGVTIVDVRIRRADLPQENTQAILSRMQSERQRVAAQARAEGAEASQKIRADAERDRTVLLADAKATADKLRGEGEAEATTIYAKAFGQDPAFFSIWRTLQGYRDIFDSGTARLVVSPDNDYLRYLQVPAGGPITIINLPRTPRCLSSDKLLACELQPICGQFARKIDHAPVPFHRCPRRPAGRVFRAGDPDA